MLLWALPKEPRGNSVKSWLKAGKRYIWGALCPSSNVFLYDSSFFYEIFLTFFQDAELPAVFIAQFVFFSFYSEAR